MNSFLSSLQEEVLAQAQDDDSVGKCFFQVELELLRLANLTETEQYLTFQEDVVECGKVVNAQAGTAFFAKGFKNFELAESLVYSRKTNVLQHSDCMSRRCLTFIAEEYPLIGRVPVEVKRQIKTRLRNTATAVFELHESIDFLLASGKVSRTRQRALDPRETLVYVKAAVLMESDVHVFTAS